MEIALHPTGDRHTVIAVTGRLDLTSVGAFRAATGHAIEDGSVNVIVDLQHVDFIDSSGLGALVGEFRRARDAGGDLRIVAPLPEVHELLSLMRLDRVLPPYPTVDAALEGL
jgi:anti-anti-sigma factor